MINCVSNITSIPPSLIQAGEVAYSQSSSKPINTMFALCIPSIDLRLTAVSHWLYPFTRTKRVIRSPKLLAWRKLLTTSLNASTHTVNPHHQTPVRHTWSNLHNSANNVWSTISCANVEWWLDFGSGIWHIWSASAQGLEQWIGDWGGYLASNPAVLQVNLRHWRSSPSSDIMSC